MTGDFRGDATFKSADVLVTGHTGFKGSWLTAWLHDLGARVHGYALPDTPSPSMFERCDLQGLLSSDIRGDLRELESVTQAVATSRPRFVFHMAAQSLVRRSYAEPLQTFATNVLGTANLLEGLRRSAVSPCTVVIVTSDKCYENREWPWGYREDDPLGGHDPYSASKACQEIVARAYQRSFFSGGNIRVLRARAGNVIGGGDWAEDRLVADFVRAIGAGEAVKCRNPTAVRPWQHVLEPLSGYLRLAAMAGAPRVKDEYNFGPTDADITSVSELLDGLVARWPDSSWVRGEDSSAPHEAGLLALSIERARFDLGWRPTWRLADALDALVEWYRAEMQGASASRLRELTLEQIRRFEA
ncbi:MAG: CDP-glucose 4,6-dehydratase [Polyangiaceae bacterium]